MPQWLRAGVEGFQLPLRLFRVLRAGPAWRHFRNVTLARSLAVALIAAGSAIYVAERPQTQVVKRTVARPHAGVELDAGDDEEVVETTTTEELPLWRKLARWLVWLYGIVWPVQWAVVALTRDYDDLFSSQLALGAGAAREVPPANPRTRLDLPWLWVQLKRRVWQLLAWAPGVVVIGALGIPLPSGVQEAFTTSLGLGWLGYWWAVGTTAKSSLVWEREATAAPPFYLRGLTWLTERIPGVRGLVRLWGRATRRLYAPAEALERAPMSLLGVAAFRLVSSLPLLSLWTRPLFPAAVSLVVAPVLPRGKRLELK